jgi:Zn-finger protein
MVKLIKIYDYSKMIDLSQLLHIKKHSIALAKKIAESILKELKKQEIINLDLLCFLLEKHQDYRSLTGPVMRMGSVMSFIEHFTIERLMELAQCDTKSVKVISFMLEVKFNYVKLLDVVNAYCSEKHITDENEKKRILNEYYTHELSRLDAEIRSQLGNSGTASDRMKLLKFLLEKHYLTNNHLKEKVRSNKNFQGDLKKKMNEALKKLNDLKALLETISAHDLQELRELERMISEQETVFSKFETEYNTHNASYSEMSKENDLWNYSSFEINQLLRLIPMYTFAFLKNPDLENMKLGDVIKHLRNPKGFPLPVAPEPIVCNHSCSIEQLTEALTWLSSGIGGMFKKLDPSLFILLLTSTFDSHKCGYFNVSERLFNEVVKSNVLNGGKVGPQADCEAHVCHDRNGCLPCLCAYTIMTFLKYGPNCITGRDHATSFKTTKLHCSVNDGAIKSLLVSMSTLDSYGLFCLILYLCQQMDYFTSNIAKDRKVVADHKKIADVKFLIALLVQHHLPTNPCLSVLVERYKIPTIVETPIPLTEIALSFSSRSDITIEGASERILAINREYFSPQNVADRLKSTKDRLTRWCHADAAFTSWHGHGLQERCPPGCWCCG